MYFLARSVRSFVPVGGSYAVCLTFTLVVFVLRVSFQALARSAGRRYMNSKVTGKTAYVLVSTTL